MKTKIVFLVLTLVGITLAAFSQANCPVPSTERCSFQSTILGKHTEYCESHNCSYSYEENNFKTMAIQERVGIDTIVCNQMYVVYSGSSYVTNLSNIFTTSNIFIIKGIADTVWIFGTGYGGRDTLTSPTYTSTRQALADALDADSIIRYYFGMNPSLVKLQYIVPHKHFDHINWEFVTSLFDTLGYSRSNSKIYVHANDYLGAYNNCSVLDQPLVQTLGVSTNPNCTTLLMNFASAMGAWEVYKGDGNHTTGTINMDNQTYQIRIEGAASSSGCTLPTNWYELAVHKSMANYIDTVFCFSTGLAEMKNTSDLFSVFPNPSCSFITIEFTTEINSDVLLEIKNIHGSVVYKTFIKKSVKEEKEIIDVANFTDGLYFITVSANNKVSVQKLFIQH